MTPVTTDDLVSIARTLLQGGSLAAEQLTKIAQNDYVLLNRARALALQLRDEAAEDIAYSETGQIQEKKYQTIADVLTTAVALAIDAR